MPIKIKAKKIKSMKGLNEKQYVCWNNTCLRDRAYLKADDQR